MENNRKTLLHKTIEIIVIYFPKCAYLNVVGYLKKQIINLNKRAKLPQKIVIFIYLIFLPA